MGLSSPCWSWMLPGRPGKILVFITCFGKQSHGFSWGNQEAHSQDRPTLPSWDHVPRRGTSVGACHPPLDHHTSPPGCGSPTCCSCWPWSLAPWLSGHVWGWLSPGTGEWERGHSTAGSTDGRALVLGAGPWHCCVLGRRYSCDAFSEACQDWGHRGIPRSAFLTSEDFRKVVIS